MLTVACDQVLEAGTRICSAHNHGWHARRIHAVAIVNWGPSPRLKRMSTRRSHLMRQPAAFCRRISDQPGGRARVLRAAPAAGVRLPAARLLGGVGRMGHDQPPRGDAAVARHLRGLRRPRSRRQSRSGVLCCSSLRDSVPAALATIVFAACREAYLQPPDCNEPYGKTILHSCNDWKTVAWF